MNYRIFIQILAVLVILVLASVGMFTLMKMKPSAKQRAEPPLPPLVATQTVTFSAHGAQVISHGRLQPLRNLHLSSRVSGKIQWVSPQLESGNILPAGAELIRIDPQEYEQALAQADQAVAEAALRVATTEAEAANRALEWQRAGRQANDPLARYEPQIAAAKAQLATAQAQRDTAAQRLIDTTIIAPESIVVTDRLVTVGDVINAGQALTSAMATATGTIQLALNQRETAALAWDYETDLAVAITTTDGRERQGRLVRGGQFATTLRNYYNTLLN